jgi:hypothetical protein
MLPNRATGPVDLLTYQSAVNHQWTTTSESVIPNTLLLEEGLEFEIFDCVK